MYPMKRPAPETIQICVVCGQPWEQHVELAYWRLTLSNEDETNPSEEEVEEGISWVECIRLLQEVNRGPMGPPGPIGPMGAPGRPA